MDEERLQFDRIAPIEGFQKGTQVVGVLLRLIHFIEVLLCWYINVVQKKIVTLIEGITEGWESRAARFKGGQVWRKLRLIGRYE